MTFMIGPEQDEFYKYVQRMFGKAWHQTFGDEYPFYAAKPKVPEMTIKEICAKLDPITRQQWSFTSTPDFAVIGVLHLIPDSIGVPRDAWRFRVERRADFVQGYLRDR